MRRLPAETLLPHRAPSRQKDFSPALKQILREVHCTFRLNLAPAIGSKTLACHAVRIQEDRGSVQEAQRSEGS